MHLRFRSQRPAAISYQQTYNVPPWNGALLRRRSSSSISSDYILPPQISSSLPPPPPILSSFFFRHSSASCPWSISTDSRRRPFSLPSFSLSPSLPFPSLPWNAAYFLFRAFSPSLAELILYFVFLHLSRRYIRRLHAQKNFNRFLHRFFLRFTDHPCAKLYTL